MNARFLFSGFFNVARNPVTNRHMRWIIARDAIGQPPLQPQRSQKRGRAETRPLTKALRLVLVLCDKHKRK